MVGKFIKEAKVRDQVVLATKYTFNAQPGNPNAGGNGRKNMYRAVEGSLRRLQTEYIDLLDARVGPVYAGRGGTVLVRCAGAVRQGSLHRVLGRSRLVRCAGANPGRATGRERIIALQLEYSLVKRNIEREQFPPLKNWA